MSDEPSMEQNILSATHTWCIASSHYSEPHGHLQPLNGHMMHIKLTTEPCQIQHSMSPCVHHKHLISCRQASFDDDMCTKRVLAFVGSAFVDTLLDAWLLMPFTQGSTRSSQSYSSSCLACWLPPRSTALCSAGSLCKHAHTH